MRVIFTNYYPSVTPDDSHITPAVLLAACRSALLGLSAEDLAAAAAAGSEGLGAADWACVRREAFPPEEGNAYRHLRLHDYTDNVSSLPR